MKKYKQSKKLRAIPLIRCSTFGQADTSISDQLKSIQAYAIEKNILLLKAHELPGVSGSIRTNIEKAVYAIIQRKESGEQIDAIIVYDLSRFTRSGPYHFGKLMTILEDAGIKLIEIVDDLGDSEMAPIFRVLKAEAAHRQAMSIADNCARGSRTSLEVGRRTYCSRQPYGIDRLYVNADERPLYIMRDLGPRLSNANIEKMADLIISDLRAMLDGLAKDHDPALRQLCETLIDQATADLEKREVKFNFAIPASMLVQRDVCPATIQGSQIIPGTNKWQSIPIIAVTLVLPRKCQGDCLDPFKPKGCNDCRRKRKAA